MKQNEYCKTVASAASFRFTALHIRMLRGLLVLFPPTECYGHNSALNIDIFFKYTNMSFCTYFHANLEIRMYE